MEQDRWFNLDISRFTKVGHWCPKSQRFAGADQLLYALYHGWQPDSQVLLEYYYHTSSCAIPVYRFRLRRRGEIMEMPVISTPYLTHLIKARRLHVVRIPNSDLEHFSYDAPGPLEAQSKRG